MKEETENIIFKPYGFIYITTNLINGKKYIGQRKFNKGWKSYLGSGVYLKNSIKKYGKENFSREIIILAYNAEELNELEIQYIELHNAVVSDDYYNLKEGGKCANPLSGKTEEEMAERNIKISKAFKGNNHPNYGKSMSREQKIKISESKIGKYRGIDSPHARKIICITTGEIFNCINDAEEKYKIAHGISMCCQGKRKSCGKSQEGVFLQWQYYDEWLKNPKQLIKQEELYITEAKKIICVTTKEIFDSISIAKSKYVIDNISACIRGKRNYAGNLPDGTKLKWMYYKEYLEQIKNKEAV